LATIEAVAEVVKNNSGDYDAHMAARECPMCGEFMRLEVKEHVQHVPGTSQVVKSQSKEWTCPECDYFEEDDGSGEASSGS